MKRIKRFFLFLVVVSLPNVPWAGQLVVFGDSLSDVGNVYADSRNGGLIPDPPPPYSAGRLSNGPIWVDYLAQSLRIAAPTASQSDLAGTGYAYAGSAIGQGTRLRPSIAIPGQTQTVSDTGKQIQQFLTANPAGFEADQLVLFWAGSQNLLQAALTGHLIAGLETVSRAIDELASELRMLDRNGARRVLLPNQIDASSAPYFADPAFPPGIRSLLVVLTVDFNRQLSALLATLMSDPAFHADLYTVDMFGLVKAVENAPSAFGFDNVTVPLITDPAVANGDRYLFWDPIHPTTQGHRLLADAAFRALPLPSTPLLMLAALGVLAVIRNAPIFLAGNHGGSPTRVRYREIEFEFLHSKPRGVLWQPE